MLTIPYIDAVTYTVSVINGHPLSTYQPLQVMVYLLEHGADPNALDMTTRSCLLHWACQKGCLEAVKILVHFKADVNMRVSESCVGVFASIGYLIQSSY